MQQTLVICFGSSSHNPGSTRKAERLLTETVLGSLCQLPAVTNHSRGEFQACFCEQVPLRQKSRHSLCLKAFWFFPLPYQINTEYTGPLD